MPSYCPIGKVGRSMESQRSKGLYIDRSVGFDISWHRSKVGLSPSEPVITNIESVGPIGLGFCFARGSIGVASSGAINVLLLLLCRLENLENISLSLPTQILGLQLTWNEHNKLSSTLIMAPALSNSPQ